MPAQFPIAHGAVIRFIHRQHDKGLVGDILHEVRGRHPGLDPVRTGHEIMRRHITRLVEDVIATTLQRLSEDGIGRVEDVRAASRTVVDFSARMREQVAQTRSFLFKRVYRNPMIFDTMGQAERVVEDLFDRFNKTPGLLPDGWSEKAAGLPPERLARHVGDYLSGMTDSFALAEHRRLFDDTPDLR